MNATVKNLLVSLLFFGLILVLTGCTFSSKAQKLVDQFDAGEELTLEIIIEKMGEATIDFTAGGSIGLKSGAVVWVKGCETYDEVKAKWEAEEKVEALVVTLLAGKVTSVDLFDNYTENDAK